jgi:DNA-binding NtrC family response regulator
LEHAIEKAVILTDADQIGSGDFFFGADEAGFSQQPETLDEMEKRMIMGALKKNRQNQSITAEQLGITRQTLYNKLKKYGI